jgi:hypothetical protein
LDIYIDVGFVKDEVGGWFRFGGWFWGGVESGGFGMWSFIHMCIQSFEGGGLILISIEDFIHRFIKLFFNLSPRMG